MIVHLRAQNLSYHRILKRQYRKSTKSMMVRMLRSYTFYYSDPPIHDDFVCCMLFCELCCPKKSFRSPAPWELVNPWNLKIPKLDIFSVIVRTPQPLIMPGLGTRSAALFSLFGGELLGFEKDRKAVKESAGGFHFVSNSTVGFIGFSLGKLRDGDVWQKSKMLAEIDQRSKVFCEVLKQTICKIVVWSNHLCIC